MRTSPHEVGHRPVGRAAALAALPAALLALGALTGCKPVGPNYSRPGFPTAPAYKETGATSVIVPPPNPAGGGWTTANPSDGMLKGKWWEIYGDPQLDALEDRIEPNNVQLRQALETYLAARDLVSATRANLYPTLSAGPSISRDRVSANRPLVASSTSSTTVYNDFVLGGQASWEPDFWGRIRRSVEAASATAQTAHAVVAHARTAQQVREIVFVVDGLTEQRSRLFRAQRLRIHPRRLQALCFT